MTDTTPASMGLTLRLTMVWKYMMAGPPQVPGPPPYAARGAWPCCRATTILNSLLDAMAGPAPTAMVPALHATRQLCMPNHSHMGNCSEQSVVDHLAGTATAFLGRLEDGVNRALEAVAMCGVDIAPPPTKNAYAVCYRRDAEHASCPHGGFA